MDGSKPLAICVRPLGSSTSTLELVFDSRLGCVVPDGKLQKITNVNFTAKCLMCMGINKSVIICEESSCWCRWEEMGWLRVTVKLCVSELLHHWWPVITGILGENLSGNKVAELLWLCSFCCVMGHNVSRVPSPQSQWESDAENASGGRRESTVTIRTRYLSLDFFPVVNAPLLGASQCVCSSTSKTGPRSLKGKIGKEVEETQCGLYHLRTPARHWQLRNTTTYIHCHAALKTNTNNDSRHTEDV